mmetsp:Transcript_8984/g.39539  ORF Transcript_8984/g.39539 Transcript_8984/m.39539 type:complete len:260 (-) Transcript_8984:693-1472(-)
MISSQTQRRLSASPAHHVCDSSGEEGSFILVRIEEPPPIAYRFVVSFGPFSVLLPLVAPLAKEPHRLLARLRAAAEREPHERVPPLPVEIQPRNARHAGDVQDALAQRDGIGRYVGHVGVDVIRPTRGGEFGEPRLREPRHQDLAIPGVFRHAALQHGVTLRVERGGGGDLRDVGRVDEEVLLQRAHRRLQPGGNDGPTDAPAGHAVVLAERVDHQACLGSSRRRQRRRRALLAVFDLVVDLVRHEPHLLRFAPVDQLE